MKLSILICSHKKRKPLLRRMLKHLNEQTYRNPEDVEILVCENDDPFVRGTSRNSLIDRASGDYCCFVDDDDIVSDDYVSKILNTIETGPEICSITGLVISMLNHESHKFMLSTRHTKPFSLPSNDIEDDTYKRFASHLNPIKTEIIRQVRFSSEKICHEDNTYSQRLKDFKQDWNEEEIDGVLYYYFNRVKIS